MAIDFPEFIDKEIPSPEKFNAFVQSLKAKFTAGLSGAEIVWPLAAGGSLNMGEYDIIGGTKIMKVVNAAAYDTLQAAVTAASGGALFIPPGDAITADGVDLPGNSITIFGAGTDSVLRLSGDTAGHLLRSSTDEHQVIIANLTLDGNDETSQGLVLRRAVRTFLHNVHFKDFGEEALYITGNSGSPSSGVVISDCIFRNGSDHHILVDDCRNLVISGCFSEGCNTSAFELVPSSTSEQMVRVNVSNNLVYNFGTNGIIVDGAAASFGSNYSDIVVSGNVIRTGGSATDPALVVGSDSGYVQNVAVSGNVVTDCPGDSIRINARYGTVSSNVAQGSGADGIDAGSSTDLIVTGNNCRDAGAYGIDAGDTTDCVFRANDCADATTGDLNFSASADHYDNGDVVAPGPPRVFYSNANTVTIPANLLKAGDHLRVAHNVDVITGSTDTVVLSVDSQTIALIAVSGTDPGQAHLLADVFITGSTGFDSIFSAFSESGSTGLRTGRFQQTGVDLSSDVIVTSSNTGASITPTGLLVELSRGENQS